MQPVWFIHRDGKQHGPVNHAKFRSFVDEGRLRADDLIWRDGMADWTAAVSLQELMSNPVPKKELVENHETSNSGDADKSPITSTTPQKSSRMPRGGTILWVIFGSLAVVIALAEPHSVPYRLTAALNGAFFGAIGGGLGGLMEYIVRRRWGTTAMSIGAVLGFLIAHTIQEGAQYAGDKVYDQAVRPKVDRTVIEHRLTNDQSNSVFRTLRDHDPATFQRAIDEILATSESGGNVDSAINVIRKNVIEPILMANARYLSDEVILRYANLIVNQMQTFETQRPALCVSAMRGQSLGEIRPYLTKSLLVEEMSLLDVAIRADKSDPKPIIAAADQGKMVEAIILKLAETHGEDIGLLEPTANFVGKEKIVCRVGADFFREILILPSHNSAALLRSLFTGSAM